MTELRKIIKYGQHKRDRPLRAEDVLQLRREIIQLGDWKAEGEELHIDGEVLHCGTAQRAELIALVRNGMLAVLNDNVKLRSKIEQMQISYNSLAAAFKSLWDRTNGK